MGTQKNRLNAYVLGTQKNRLNAYVVGTQKNRLNAYVVGTQKNRLNETVLLSTQNIMLKLMGKKHVQFYPEKLCLSKPVTRWTPTDKIACHTKCPYIFFGI